MKENKDRLGLDINLRLIQEIELDILLEFDRICKKHGLKYQLYSGTLIGTVRHKGFIPWDDDIDVAMPRADYDKFIELKDELADDYFFQSYETDPQYINRFGKIRKNGTVFMEKLVKELDMHHGIYIDVFPFDNIKPHSFSGKLQLFILRKLDSFFKYRLKERQSSLSGFKKTSAKFKYKLIKILPISKLALDRWLEKIMMRFNDEQTEYMADLTNPSPEVLEAFKMRREDLEDTIKGRFEGHDFPIPKNYHELLSRAYGNYMEMPPEDERFSHHDIIKIEIDSYEERDLDYKSNKSQSNILSLIAREMNVSLDEIRDVNVLDKGMTNRSFRFTVKGRHYIMRVPGEGTEELISRVNEYQVYKKIRHLDISDKIVYISPNDGYKITEFLSDARECDPFSEDDLKRCMDLLRNFHSKELEVSHEFDIFKEIDFYESLWEGEPSTFKDYKETKENVRELKHIIDSMDKPWVLTHIDPVPDNFLFAGDDIYLIDWEYSAMQDPHLDIAMFAIYPLYTRKEIDQLIDIYFEGKCERDVRIKIYCYIAACGLLWSNWCEYKRLCGVDFDEYSLRQYGFAKDFYKIVKEEIKKEGERDE